MRLFKEMPMVIRIILLPIRSIQFVVYVLIALALIVISEEDKGDKLLMRIVDEGRWV